MKKTVIPLPLSFFLLLLALNSNAQYPFEKYPAIKYKELVFHSWYNSDSSKKYIKANLNGFGVKKSKYSLLIVTPKENDFSVLYIKKGNKIIQKFREEWPFYYENLSHTGSIADFNNDSMTDIKLSFTNWGGCGIAGLELRRIYLFQNKKQVFTKIAFNDMTISENYLDSANKWLPERDVNYDGVYKIMVCRLASYKYHNYWTFDLYNYLNGELVCVDDKYNYPIMVQYLDRENHEITKRISPDKMKTFKVLKPEGYDKR